MEEAPLGPVVDEPQAPIARVEGHDEEVRLSGEGGPDAVDLEPFEVPSLLPTPRAMSQSRIGPSEEPQLGSFPEAARVEFLDRRREPARNPFAHIHATASSSGRVPRLRSARMTIITDEGVR